jgi:hypothetical protein
MSVPLDRVNSLYGNKFETKEDVQDAFNTLFEPLVSRFTDGCARVQFDGSGAIFDRAAIDLEGFARPLWGVVPYVLGGGEFKHWDLYVKGLENGTNPKHPEYWGDVGSFDQRQVELAALGFALFYVPEHLWEPLSEEGKKNVSTYLLAGRNGEYPGCNWKFFRVLVDLGLQKVGVEVDQNMTEEYLTDLEKAYVDEGWYRDGVNKGEMLRIDYYNPFAMHFYGLIYAIANPKDTRRAELFQKRAKEYASQYIHWFDDEGAALPFGRSLTYRFACGSLWGAFPLAENEALPWGVLKGLYLRHWRWWAKQPMMRMDEKVLPVGYSYPNTLMSEMYNSQGSPYWAFKHFIALALPSEHPFWTAKEEPMPEFKNPATMSVPGMISTHYTGNTNVLSSGAERVGMPSVAEKYGKFAYSTRYGFSVEYDERRFHMAVFDSMIAFSDDDAHFRVRERCTVAKAAPDLLYSKWNPWKDVEVETYLYVSGQWHVRVHKVTSPRELSTIEGGFCIPRLDFNKTEEVVTSTSASATANTDDNLEVSGILDLSHNRQPRVHKPEGNTNLIIPRTVVPQLQGTVPANTPTTFITAVLANPGKAAEEAWECVPQKPDPKELEKLINEKGDLIGIWKN